MNSFRPGTWHIERTQREQVWARPSANLILELRARIPSMPLVSCGIITKPSFAMPVDRWKSFVHAFLHSFQKQSNFRCTRETNLDRKCSMRQQQDESAPSVPRESIDSLAWGTVHVLQPVSMWQSCVGHLLSQDKNIMAVWACLASDSAGFAKIDQDLPP